MKLLRIMKMINSTMYLFLIQFYQPYEFNFYINIIYITKDKKDSSKLIEGSDRTEGSKMEWGRVDGKSNQMKNHLPKWDLDFDYDLLITIIKMLINPKIHGV